MSITVTRSGPGVPTQVWGIAESRQLGQNLVTRLRMRVHDQGRDADGRKFRKYSKIAISIPTLSGIGLRRAPQGGKLSESGKTMRFKGGYREYVLLSTGQAHKNLVASGELRRSWKVKRASAVEVIVGINAEHGILLNKTHKFIGLSRTDRIILRRVATTLVRRRIGMSRS